MVTSVPYQLRSSQIATRARASARSTGSAPATCAAASVARRRAAERRQRARALSPSRRRRPRGARPAAGPWSGERYEVEVGPVAHGGHRASPGHEASRVVFVRHALPGERVVVEVTEGSEGDRFWRGDAVEVLEAVARPGRRRRARTPARGAAAAATSSTSTLAAQRALKAAVVARAAAPAGRARRRRDGRGGARATTTGCGWRTRMQCAVDRPTAGAGLRKHRSHEVVAGRRLPDRAPGPADVTGTSGRTPPASSDRLRDRRAAAAGPTATATSRTGRAAHRAAAGRTGRSPAAASGRCTRGAADALVDAVLDGAATRSRGSGCSTCTPASGCSPASLADAVGPTGRVVAVEGDRDAPSSDAAANLADLPQVALVARPGRPGARRRRRRAASTWSCSTRRATGAKRDVVARDRAPGAAGGRLRRLRPGRPGPRRGDLRRARLRAGGAARLRPVPDDPPRRVRRDPRVRADADVVYLDVKRHLIGPAGPWVLTAAARWADDETPADLTRRSRMSNRQQSGQLRSQGHARRRTASPTRSTGSTRSRATASTSTSLPYSLKVLLENLLRTEDGANITADDIRALAGWDAGRRARARRSSSRRRA